MAKNTFKVQGIVWLYQGVVAWYFLTVPKKQSASIKKAFGAKSRGWGSLPVTVTIGETIWKTSVFPDRKSGTYVLPLKAEIRRKEMIGEGDTVVFTLEIGV